LDDKWTCNVTYRSGTWHGGFENVQFARSLETGEWCITEKGTYHGKYLIADVVQLLAYKQLLRKEFSDYMKGTDLKKLPDCVEQIDLEGLRPAPAL
jgi:hypothetical protein